MDPRPDGLGGGVTVALLSGLAATLAVALALGPLEGMPHVSDEVAYAMQARIFATARLFAEAPAAPSMVLYPFVGTDPGIHAVFPPGWPALLALGTLLRFPILVNPLLAACLPPLTWRIARSVADAPTARVAAAISALSPGVLVLAASRMSQTSVLVALLVLAGSAGGVGATARASTAGRPTLLDVAAAAGALAYVVLARPLDALCVGGPLLAVTLWRRRDAAGLALGIGLPLLATLALGAFNHALTGDPLTFPADRWFDAFYQDRPGCNRLGFGADVGCAGGAGAPGYTPMDGLVTLVHNVLTFDRLLLGVPGGLLLAVGGLVLLGRRAPVLWIPLLVPVAYFFYWSPGVAYGARFYHPLYVVVPTLVALALCRLARHWAMLPVLAGAAVGLLLSARDLSSSYWCVDGSLRDALEEGGITEGVVFLDAVGTRGVTWPYLGVDGFTCDRLLESGDGFALSGPEAKEGLLFRHMTTDRSQALPYLSTEHPGAVGWVDQHRIDVDVRRVVPLDQALRRDAPPAGGIPSAGH